MKESDRDMMNLFQNKLSLGTADCHRAALEIDMDNVAICSTSYNVVPDFMDIVNIFLVNNHNTEVIPKKNCDIQIQSVKSKDYLSTFTQA